MEDVNSTGRFDWAAQKVLVTGASGFKGSWLCGILTKLGAEVYGTVRNRVHPESPYALLDLRHRIVEAPLDITDRQQVADLVNSVAPSVIFHLAAKAVVPVCSRDPRRAFEVNVMGTVNLLEACRRVPACRLLVCSTDHVFGDVREEDLPLCEDHAVSGSGPYETSKAAMELVVRCYHAKYPKELPWVCITRSANVFGFADTAPRRIIPEFVQAGLEKRVIPYQTRLNGRQFIHVADTVSGYIQAAANLPGFANDPTPTFHFSLESYEGVSDRFIRVEQLANMIAQLTGARTEPPKEAAQYALNENPVLALSCECTRQLLGWAPRKGFTEALKELVDWYRDPRLKSREERITAAVIEAARNLRQ